jgi:hypothetical protein
VCCITGNPVEELQPERPRLHGCELHVAARSPNLLIMEKGSTRTETYNDIFQDCWKTTLGGWRVPEGPGLGVDFSPDQEQNIFSDGNSLQTEQLSPER